MTRPSGLSLAVLLAVTAVGLSGCLGGGNADSSRDGEEPDIGSVPRTVDTRTISLPLDAFRPDPDQLHQISQARAILTTRCLKRFGYDIPVPEIPKSFHAPHERRYGMVDQKYAERFGYHGDSERLARRAKEPDLPPAAFNIMHGEVSSAAGVAVPEGGCLGEAARILESPAQDMTNFIDNLNWDSKARSDNDSRVRDLFTRWSTCMAEAGFTYSTPSEATNDPRWGQTGVASDAEIAVAVADAGCKDAVALVPVWYSVDAAYQRGYVNKHLEALREVEVQIEQQSKAAAAVLGVAR